MHQVNSYPLSLSIRLLQLLNGKTALGKIGERTGATITNNCLPVDQPTHVFVSLAVHSVALCSIFLDKTFSQRR